MASFPPPPPESSFAEYKTRPLPTGWIQETDPASGRPYFIDTLALDRRPTWEDPRTNPALAVEHDPSLGVTVHHVLRNQSPAPASNPPSLVSYPDYPPRQQQSTAVLTAAGALITGGMIVRAVGTTAAAKS